MLRRLAREASSAAKGHDLGLPGQPCSAASRGRRLLGPPSPGLPLAAGARVNTGAPVSFVRAFSSGFPAASSASARRCVANVCTTLASRWITSSSTTEDSGSHGSAGQPGLQILETTPRDDRSLPAFEYDDEDLVDPDVYFQENPILVDLDNEFVSDLGGRSGKKVPDDIRGTFHSLLDLVVEHHLDDRALLEALEENNLLINSKTGKFVLKEVKTFRLNPVREKLDFSELHERIVGYVERRHGKGSTSLLPEDVQDFLEKLKAECLNVKLLYMHPMFLSWLDRVLFRTLSDICVRMPAIHERKTKEKGNVKDKLMKVICEMPYVGRAPGAVSSETMDSTVANNTILNSSNTHRENQRQEREADKKSLAEWRKRGKEAKKNNKLKLAATAAAGGGQGTHKITAKPAARGGGPKGKQAAEASVRGPSYRKSKRAFATEAPGGGDEAIETAASSAGGGGAEAKETPGKEHKFDQAKFSSGCRLISLNRDGFNHLVEIAKRIEKVISLEKLSEMLHAVFPKYEFKLVDLLEEAGIWDVLRMATVFKVSAKKLEAIIKKDAIRRATYLAEEKLS